MVTLFLRHPVLMTKTNHDDEKSNSDYNCGLNKWTTSRMALWTEAWILIRIVTAIIATIANFPAEYTPVVRLAAKHTFSTAACLCYNTKHLQCTTSKSDSIHYGLGEKYWYWTSI